MSVYICHRDGLRRNPIDVSDAARFGDLITVFGREIFPDDADDVIGEFITRAETILLHFNPANDYLALVGSPLHISLCTAAIVARGIRRYNVLRYDRQNDGYYPVCIDLERNRQHA